MEIQREKSTFSKNAATICNWFWKGWRRMCHLNSISDDYISRGGGWGYKFQEIRLAHWADADHVGSANQTRHCAEKDDPITIGTTKIYWHGLTAYTDQTI
jgi:hypothetical protein